MNVIHEDNHLLVVYKPVGLLSQADHTGDPTILDAARAWLVERHDKPGGAFVASVHRLDRPVAGVMVLAKTSKAASRLAEQFRRGAVGKTYRAVVTGHPTRATRTLVHHLLRSYSAGRGTEVRVVGAGTAQARRSELRYDTLARAGGRSLLEVALVTGRSHQIRVQLSAMGHPIVGDTKYGSRQPLPGRMIALYASRLELAHPTRRERMAFEAQPPEHWPW